MPSPDLNTNSGPARDRFEALHQELRDRICLLDYAPGTRLSETVLAEEFGVSRTPMRRVLARLEAEGLLHSVQGVGTFVTDASIDELEQVYRLRMELAELSGRLAPLRPTPNQLDGFRQISIRAKALIYTPDPRAFARLIMDFFLALLALTDNAPLREISERLYFQTTRIWLTSLFDSVLDAQREYEIFNREVEDILVALEIGDMQAAAHIQRAHISMSFTRMQQGTS